MEEEEETPHWKSKKGSSKFLEKFIGKNCSIGLKNNVYIHAYQRSYSSLNGIINGYDDTFIDVTIAVTHKDKKETITKKYNYLVELDNISIIGMEVE